ncbi:MAG: hypothetical protein AB1461_14165, partial [Thermodesulfobacteriota bacterium]
LHLNRKILTVALLRLRFCSIAATKSDPNLSAILTILFWDRPLGFLGHLVTALYAVLTIRMATLFCYSGLFACRQ